MKNKRLIIVATDGEATRALYHELEKKFGVYKVILEEPVSKKLLVQRRIKNLGLSKVIGQVLFILFVQPILHKSSMKRIKEIISTNGLCIESIPSSKIINVKSINDEVAHRVIKELNPDLIIINGTRIISKKTLNSVTCRWVNIHAGITPKYRGVHGAYWALVNNDEELCGVTVHFVDQGIDTGGVIAQSLIYVSSKDNFSTYPYLQYAAGLKLLKDLINEYYTKSFFNTANSLTYESKLWYHPTLTGYLWNRLKKKIR